MSDQGVEVWSGGVNTWECDEMGHLNVRFWVAKAQEGLAGLAAQLGMPRAFARDGESTLVVREQHIRFLREAKPGASLHMTGGVIEIGESDARLLLVIRHMDGQPAATFQLLVDHATTRELRPFPWPERILQRAKALAIDVPAYAAARSIDLSPVVPTASLARADELGLKRIGLGVIGPAECDVFGRMRPELFIGRVSDGVGRLFGDVRPGPADGDAKIGGAVLEYRVLHLGWPEAGDGVELRSGFAGCDARTRRVMHWMVDPQSGRPWASAEAVVVSFDLERRKVVDISAEAQAAFRAASPPGLAL
ncbi:thioesterase [Phenylobacterium sp. Root77]|uniref:thioesterase family protein n=1 Tax=unclassified Phenylobacterium TaxID=2640670 RepID=UPI0006F8F79F|nr:MULTISPECIES: thioesterase family protein [unclassified Phenylobacterium]KQW70971.1 thioesterase [Phenylobacterium sp. Root1277]KQW95871.1 thioesterase [Phenylobacterium sp. Root1290]KRC41656.1 thioesterase [Phenylobacterium sp. Root77]